MIKPLSQHLADLSVCAKEAEDAFAAARSETHDRVVERREEARVKAVALADRVDKDLRGIGDSIAGQWNALQTKIAADIDRLKTNYDQFQRDRSVDRADHRADRLETEAGVALDFALATIEDAKRAVLDAVAARIEANDAHAT